MIQGVRGQGEGIGRPWEGCSERKDSARRVARLRESILNLGEPEHPCKPKKESIERLIRKEWATDGGQGPRGSKEKRKRRDNIQVEVLVILHGDTEHHKG